MGLRSFPDPASCWCHNESVPRAAFTTLGCKVNQYETQRILDQFASAGFEVVPFETPADVYVVNTCSVTSIAESKSRYTVRRAKRIAPEARVVVTGCAGQMAINRGEAFEGADLVVENPAKISTLERCLAAWPELRPSEPSPLRAPSGRTRATLKVQDGCNVLCSYCSIPFTRPGMISRPSAELLDEAERMAQLGYREIVLTGVLIGAYGPESGSGGFDFEDLIEAMQARLAPYPMRLRISSIELRQVTPRLLRIMARKGPVPVVPHLHIPLQSGSSQVLSDMNRPYRQSDYLEVCREAKEAVPGLGITTDIMVGFPTEDDEAFAETLHVCDVVRFAKIHAFRFSPRFGTPADDLGDPVSPAVKQERSRILGLRSDAFGAAHAQAHIGRVCQVLVEGKPTPGGLLEGLTDTYVTVQFAGPRDLLRAFAWVRIEETRGALAFGELAAPEAGLRVVAQRG